MPVPKILVVDDTPAVRELVRAALSPFQVTVLDAATGQAALHIVQQQEPDLILLDVTLPGVDGIDVLRQLKRDSVLRRIPVFMLTGQSVRELVVKVAHLGAHDFVAKPFSPAVLVEKILRILPLETTAGAPAAGGSGGRLVLLVEDKEAIVRRILDEVQDPAWTWEHVNSAAEATAIAAARDVAAAVVSLTLPEGAAFLLPTEFRQQPHGKDTVFIGLALKAAAKPREQAVGAGYLSIADKPIVPASLRECVQAALQPPEVPLNADNATDSG
jgi:two-component system cell cycle response regulator